MRRKVTPKARASATPSKVLPMPGTSSMSRCPRASRVITVRRTASGLPTKTRATESISAWTEGPEVRAVDMASLVWGPGRPLSTTGQSAAGERFEELAELGEAQVAPAPGAVGLGEELASQPRPGGRRRGREGVIRQRRHGGGLRRDHLVAFL